MVYILYIENSLYYPYVSTNLSFSLVELETHKFQAVYIKETPKKKEKKIQKKIAVNR